MVGRLDFYNKQKVNEAQLDQAFQFFEDALLARGVDLDLLGFTFGGNSTEQSPQAFGIEVSGPSVAYDKDGHRAAYEDPQKIDLTLDLDNEATAVVTVGNSKWLTVTIQFGFSLTDLQPLPPAPYLNYFLVKKPSFKFSVHQGVEDVAPVKPVIGGIEVIVCDVLIAFGQLVIVNGDIDAARKQVFTGIAPGLHAADHETGGIDEIQHDNLQGAGSLSHAAIDTHIGDVANPHATDLANLGTGLLAELNSRITDANLDDATATRPPSAHNTDHQHGGGDEIAVVAAAANAIPKAGALGKLADDWIAASSITQHEGSISHQNLSGAGSNDHAAIDSHLANIANPHNTSLANLVSGNLAALNALLTDATLDSAGTARPPLGHNASHQHGGGDEIASSVPLANAIPKALGTGVLDPNWVIFGSNFHGVSRTSSLSTTLGPLPAGVEYLSLTTGSLQAGTYRIGWFGIFNYNNAADDFEMRVQIDNSIDVIDPANGGVLRIEPADAGADQRIPVCGFRFVALGAGVHTIDMDFADGGGGTATMHHAHLEIWRVA